MSSFILQKDELQIKIKDPTLLVSVESLQPLETSEDDKLSMSHSMPRLVEDYEVLVWLSGIASSSGNTLEKSSFASFLLKLVIAGNLQEFWSMLRAM